MSRRKRAESFRYALAALAASFPAVAAQPNNLLLLVPQALPATAVDEFSTPALEALQSEGVHFLNSYSGFPKLAAPEGSQGVIHLDLDALLNDAAAAGYGVVVNAAIRRAGSASPEETLEAQLAELNKTKRPFVVAYTFQMRTPEQVIDKALSRLEQLLKEQGSYESTNIIVSGQAGLAHIWKESSTSVSMKPAYVSTKRAALPPGFVAVDLTVALQQDDPRLGLRDADDNTRWLDWGGGEHPKHGNGVIAAHPSNPYLRIEARGGHDLIYLPKSLSKREARELALVLVEILNSHDYAGGLFVDEGQVGSVPGALSMKHLGWRATRGTPLPAIAVSFASLSAGCERATACTAMIADTPSEQGRRFPGAFSRTDTWVFMAARGPDFRQGFVSDVPASQADLERTIRALLRLRGSARKAGEGRFLAESLKGYKRRELPEVRKQIIASPSDGGLTTEMHLRWVGGTKYFVAAGFPGQTVGVPFWPLPAVPAWHFWKWPIWPRGARFEISISPEDVTIEPYPPLQGKEPLAGEE